MSIKRIIKYEIRKSGLVNGEIAKHLRIPEKDFSAWLKGRKSLPFKKVWNLIDFLKIDKDIILELILNE